MLEAAVFLLIVGQQLGCARQAAGGPSNAEEDLRHYLEEPAVFSESQYAQLVCAVGRSSATRSIECVLVREYEASDKYMRKVAAVLLLGQLPTSDKTKWLLREAATKETPELFLALGQRRDSRGLGDSYRRLYAQEGVWWRPGRILEDEVVEFLCTRLMQPNLDYLLLRRVADALRSTAKCDARPVRAAIQAFGLRNVENLQHCAEKEVIAHLMVDSLSQRSNGPLETEVKQALREERDKTPFEYLRYSISNMLLELSRVQAHPVETIHIDAGK